MKIIDRLLEKIENWIRGLIPDPTEQLRQIDAHLTALESKIELLELHLQSDLGVYKGSKSILASINEMSTAMDEEIYVVQEDLKKVLSNNLGQKYFDRKFNEMSKDIKNVPRHSLIREVFKI